MYILYDLFLVFNLFFTNIPRFMVSQGMLPINGSLFKEALDSLAIS